MTERPRSAAARRSRLQGLKARRPKYFKPVAEDALDEMTQVGGMDTGVVPGCVEIKLLRRVRADAAPRRARATRER